MRTVVLRNSSELLLQLFGRIKGKPKDTVKDSRLAKEREEQQRTAAFSTFGRSVPPATATATASATTTVVPHHHSRSDSQSLSTSAGGNVFTAAGMGIEPIAVPPDTQVLSWGPFTVHVPCADLKPGAATAIHVYYTPTEWSAATHLGTTAPEEEAQEKAVAEAEEAGVHPPATTASQSQAAEDKKALQPSTSTSSNLSVSSRTSTSSNAANSGLPLADRLKLAVLQKQWTPLLSQITCIGVPGHLRLVFSTTHLKVPPPARTARPVSGCVSHCFVSLLLVG